MSTSLVWKARSMLSPAGRTHARRAADRLLSPFGSIVGAKRPTAKVALTFDDGPDPEVTPRVLDLLRAHGAKATFFVLTDRVVRHPEIVRRVVAEGHEIALHSDRHERLPQLSALAMWRRMRAAARLLEGVAGRPIALFRPPFGAQSFSTYLAARACGLQVVVWGPHAEDWVERAPEAVAARGLEHLRAGDVLLLHDGLETPAGTTPPGFDRVRAFDLLLRGMADRGLQPSTVSALVAAAGARRTAWFRP